MKRYVISPAARSDLDEVWQYVAAHNIRAADQLIDAFLKRFFLLASQPSMGQARPDLAEGVRHSPLGNYLILYRPSESEIDVLRVIHGARDVPGVFREHG